MDWGQKLIPQVVFGKIKDVVGKYTAENLISEREAAQALAFESIRNDLQLKRVVVTSLEISNIDYTNEFEKSVEDKVIADQQAIQEINKTKKVREEKEQAILRAEAEAESIRIRSEALAQNKDLVEWEDIQKWDGKLPVQMLGAAPVPFLNLSRH